MARVLLTGASGFVGRQVLAALGSGADDIHAVSSRGLADDGHGITWHRCDLLDHDATAALVGDVAAESLVHLAWYVEHGRFWTAPENSLWAGAGMRLLRAFAAAGGRRALFTGTCAEYDWSTGGPLHEEDTPAVPRTPYGQAKEALRQAATTFAVEQGIDFSWARLFFLYGPGEPPGRLVPSVARALLAGRPAPTSAGLQVRDFMHVADAGAALAALLASGVTGAVNVATGEGVTLRHIVETLGEITGRADLLRVGGLPTAPDDPASLVADTTRLAEEVGFTPRISLREGLEQTVDWWRAQA